MTIRSAPKEPDDDATGRSARPTLNPPSRDADERERIATQFHDGLGQKLTSLSLSASILVEKLEAKNLSEADDARRLLRIIKESVREARALSASLHARAADKVERTTSEGRIES